MARQHAATGDPGQPPRPALGSRAVLADADPLLVAVAVAFAVVNGANDGGTLLALSLRAAGLSVWVALVALAAMVAVAPALVGTQVATTLAVRLVDVGGAERVVVLAIPRGGLPVGAEVARAIVPLILSGPPPGCTPANRARPRPSAQLALHTGTIDCARIDAGVTVHLEQV
ncbi:MAG: hypothetical protein BRC31_02415 [Actinobacteria bacterium QS_5_72_10]|nr:MAG: hypothetical protein BRC31_02415 [Actinobacteria bacterium QS_5_72_10]